ncbi:MAG: transporter substrate-binding protein [Hyphomicrobiales bacterium]|nr:transporter substrate-binding protein [Hyphomicrobiales bacterium]
MARRIKPRQRHGARAVAAFCLAAGLCGAPAAFAQAWPTKTVTVVVPFPAGGNTDTMARLASEYLTQKLGQTFVVENRPTGGGVVAAAQVARAPADGYTLFFASAGQMVILPMMQKVNYDPEAEFAPVSILGTGPFVLGVKATIPVNTVQEFVDYARTYKDKLNVSSAGAGSIGHLTSAMFAKRGGFDLVFVPYQGGGPAMAALVAGDVDMYFGNASELLQHADGGRIKILAVSNEERMKQLPNVPPVGSIYPGFKTSSWNGFLVAKATPQPIVDKLMGEVVAASKDPRIVARLDALGIKPIGSTAQEFAAVIAEERPLYREALDAAALKMPHQNP